MNFQCRKNMIVGKGIQHFTRNLVDNLTLKILNLADNEIDD